jgi:hypothetical protein
MIAAAQALFIWAGTKGPVQTAVDGLSIGTAIASLAGWLPAIAAGFTIVWTAIRIFETDTVQKFFKRKQGE